MSSDQTGEILGKLGEEISYRSIEDGMAEDDWNGWAALTKTIGDKSNWWAMIYL